MCMQLQNVYSMLAQREGKLIYIPDLWEQQKSKPIPEPSTQLQPGYPLHVA